MSCKRCCDNWKFSFVSLANASKSVVLVHAARFLMKSWCNSDSGFDVSPCSLSIIYSKCIITRGITCFINASKAVALSCRICGSMAIIFQIPRSMARRILWSKAFLILYVWKISCHAVFVGLQLIVYVFITVICYLWFYLLGTFQDLNFFSIVSMLYEIPRELIPRTLFE